RIRDTSLVPVAARLIRAVEGVVDVEFDLAEHARTSQSPTTPSGHRKSE
ncbi:CBS domain-containing protein, partial [Streptomyces sp. 2A115]